MHYLILCSDALPIHNDIGKYRIKLWFEQVLNRKKTDEAHQKLLLLTGRRIVEFKKEPSICIALSSLQC